MAVRVVLLVALVAVVVGAVIGAAARAVARVKAAVIKVIGRLAALEFEFGRVERDPFLALTADRRREQHVASRATGADDEDAALPPGLKADLAPDVGDDFLRRLAEGGVARPVAERAEVVPAEGRRDEQAVRDGRERLRDHLIHRHPSPVGARAGALRDGNLGEALGALGGRAGVFLLLPLPGHEFGERRALGEDRVAAVQHGRLARAVAAPFPLGERPGDGEARRIAPGTHADRRHACAPGIADHGHVHAGALPALGRPGERLDWQPAGAHAEVEHAAGLGVARKKDRCDGRAVRVDDVIGEAWNHAGQVGVEADKRLWHPPTKHLRELEKAPHAPSQDLGQFERGL